jgi:hypothetical protein
MSSSTCLSVSVTRSALDAFVCTALSSLSNAALATYGIYTVLSYMVLYTYTFTFAALLATSSAA